MRALLVVLFLTLFTGVAYAQSCAGLKRALAQAQAGGGGNARLQQQARAFGCNSGSRWNQHPRCAGILARLNGVGGGNAGRVRQLRRQIARKCSGNASRTRQARRQRARQPQRQARRRGGDGGGGRIVSGRVMPEARGGNDNTFSSIFGIRSREVERTRTARVNSGRSRRGVERVNLDTKRKARREAKPDAIKTLATRSRRRKGDLRVGSSRTVCVRLCDGFYFPINSRSHSDNFYDELAMCVGRCPGADVSLYVHHRGAPVESMRSTMTGEAYVNLPTAFTYRKKLVSGCGCEQGTRIAKNEQDADTALGYVGLASTAGAEAAAEAAASWTPFKAVYDATGKPLDLSASTTPSAKARGDTDGNTAAANASSEDGAKTDGTAGADAAAGTSDAAGEPTSERPEVVARLSLPNDAEPFDLSAGSVRDVGPRFLANDEETAAERRSRTSATLATSQAVQVVPLPDRTEAR